MLGGCLPSSALSEYKSNGRSAPVRLHGWTFCLLRSGIKDSRLRMNGINLPRRHNLDNGSAISCSIRGGLACCYGQGLPSAHNVHFQCEECAIAGGVCVARGFEYQCFARSGSGLPHWIEVWLPGTDKAYHGGSDRNHLDGLCHDLLGIGINSHVTQFEPTSAEMGRVAWARQESSLTALLERLQWSKVSLTLILTTLTW